jgi:hypothetical protein
MLLNLDSFDRFIPKPPSVEASTIGGLKLSARLENVTPGECPYCKKTMRMTTACGQPMYVCDNDRAVFPLENDKLALLGEGM